MGDREPWKLGVQQRQTRLWAMTPVHSRATPPLHFQLHHGSTHTLPHVAVRLYCAHRPSQVANTKQQAHSCHPPKPPAGTAPACAPHHGGYWGPHLHRVLAALGGSDQGMCVLWVGGWGGGRGVRESCGGGLTVTSRAARHLRQMLTPGCWQGSS